MRPMRPMGPMRPLRPMGLMSLMSLIALLGCLCLTGCYREPPLHLYWFTVEAEFPVIDIRLETYWDYKMSLGINYDWHSEWYYGWDDDDRRLFGELGYTEPSKFHVRRYFTGDIPLGPRIRRFEASVEGRHYRSEYDWGYWDILVWNNVESLDADGIQSLIFNEPASPDEDITVTTGPTPNSARYHAPKYRNSFYEPEQLFSGFSSGIEVNRDSIREPLYVYDEKERCWIRNLEMLLEPVTYIYLPQVILHHNGGRISQEYDGRKVLAPAILSGMAKTTSLNTGITGEEAVAISFNMRQKYDADYKDGEKVDIIGGRLMTFGICRQNANRVSRAEEVDKTDTCHHYLDVTLYFKMIDRDSTFTFDVTDQVRSRYKGGVITVELDMDTVPDPPIEGGHGFNAIVKDFEDGGTWEFDM